MKWKKERRDDRETFKSYYYHPKMGCSDFHQSRHYSFTDNHHMCHQYTAGIDGYNFPSDYHSTNTIRPHMAVAGFFNSWQQQPAPTAALQFGCLYN